MAIVRSIGVGKGRKSAGDVTYAVVRGRTIMKSRIVENKSNTKLQADNRQAFKKMSQYVTLLDFWIKEAFEKSKYGSARNNFIAQNKEWLKTYLQNIDVLHISLYYALIDFAKSNAIKSFGIDVSAIVDFPTEEKPSGYDCKVSFMDNGYTKVTALWFNMGAAGLINTQELTPTLKNGIWSVTRNANIQKNSAYGFIIKVDGKTITSNETLFALNV